MGPWLAARLWQPGPHVACSLCSPSWHNVSTGPGLQEAWLAAGTAGTYIHTAVQSDISNQLIMPMPATVHACKRSYCLWHRHSSFAIPPKSLIWQQLCHDKLPVWFQVTPCKASVAHCDDLSHDTLPFNSLWHLTGRCCRLPAPKRRGWLLLLAQTLCSLVGGVLRVWYRR